MIEARCHCILCSWPFHWLNHSHLSITKGSTYFLQFKFNKRKRKKKSTSVFIAMRQFNINLWVKWNKFTSFVCNMITIIFAHWLFTIYGDTFEFALRVEWHMQINAVYFFFINTFNHFGDNDKNTIPNATNSQNDKMIEFIVRWRLLFVICTLYHMICICISFISLFPLQFSAIIYVDNCFICINTLFTFKLWGKKKASVWTMSSSI